MFGIVNTYSEQVNWKDNMAGKGKEDTGR